jgi:Ca2+/H+ antiporter, TMEM165/GDT1 family
VAFVLTLIGALLACGLEMLEALAIVLAVGITRRFRDAILGAAAAGVALAVLAVVLGPVLIARVPLAPLRIVIGAFLLLFGLEWLRKGVLRLAHLRSPSDSFKEFVDEQEALEALALPPEGTPDWAGRTIAFKGVLLEGVEVILIVTALGARPGGLAPTLIGGGAALVAVIAVGLVLHAPLSRLPETHLKYLVGVVLSSFGAFFAAEGLGVAWPLGDAALLYLAASFVLLSQLQIHALAGRTPAVST